jgi:hypothetical protein
LRSLPLPLGYDGFGWNGWMNQKSGLVCLTLAMRMTAISLQFTMVKVGNGEKAKFSTSPWIDSISPRTLHQNFSKYQKGKKNAHLEKLWKRIFG